MTVPRRVPSDACFDDPADKLDGVDESARDIAFVLASTGLTRIGDWITQGRGDAHQRALRSDIVLMCICPQFLPCKRPSCAWLSHQHGVSRTWANNLRKEFARFVGPYVQFHGQRFLNQTNRVQA